MCAGVWVFVDGITVCECFSVLLHATVKVCNCTALGYCYVAPGTHSFKYGMGTTVGILAGTVAFICE